jgi:hypothetical protein
MEEEIIKVTEVSKEIVPQKPKQKKRVVGRFLAIIREIVAILFWTYVLIKLFVFDIDIFLINKLFHNYAWLLNFKFFILIGTIAVIWLVTKNKHILLWSLYIFFYPAIIFFWRIPFFVFKQNSWVFAFVAINAVISFFKSIKYNFIEAALFLVSLAIVFGFSSEILLWTAISTLFTIVLIICIQRLILVFKPSNMLKIFSEIWKIKQLNISSFALDESIKNLPVTTLDQKQLEKWTTSLQTSVLFNRVCLFVAKKLRDYQDSGLNFVSYILTILLLIILTIFSFAVINLGLFKINADLFSFSATPSFFTFFYYSFNNLLFNSIQELTPVMPISQATSMIESFFALFLFAIFVSLLLSVRSQRQAEELNEVIRGIEARGIEIESFIRDDPPPQGFLGHTFRG